MIITGIQEKENPSTDLGQLKRPYLKKILNTPSKKYTVYFNLIKLISLFLGTWNNSLGFTRISSTAVVFSHQFFMFSLKGYTKLKLASIPWSQTCVSEFAPLSPHWFENSRDLFLSCWESLLCLFCELIKRQVCIGSNKILPSFQAASPCLFFMKHSRHLRLDLDGCWV